MANTEKKLVLFDKNLFCITQKEFLHLCHSFDERFFNPTRVSGGGGEFSLNKLNDTPQQKIDEYFIFIEDELGERIIYLLDILSYIRSNIKKRKFFLFTKRIQKLLLSESLPFEKLSFHSDDFCKVLFSGKFKNINIEFLHSLVLSEGMGSSIEDFKSVFFDFCVNFLERNTKLIKSFYFKRIFIKLILTLQKIYHSIEKEESPSFPLYYSIRKIFSFDISLFGEDLIENLKDAQNLVSDLIRFNFTFGNKLFDCVNPVFDATLSINKKIFGLRLRKEWSPYIKYSFASLLETTSGNKCAKFKYIKEDIQYFNLEIIEFIGGFEYSIEDFKSLFNPNECCQRNEMLSSLLFDMYESLRSPSTLSITERDNSTVESNPIWKMALKYYPPEIIVDFINFTSDQKKLFLAFVKSEEYTSRFYEEKLKENHGSDYQILMLSLKNTTYGEILEIRKTLAFLYPDFDELLLSFKISISYFPKETKEELLNLYLIERQKIILERENNHYPLCELILRNVVLLESIRLLK